MGRRLLGQPVPAAEDELGIFPYACKRFNYELADKPAAEGSVLGVAGIKPGEQDLLMLVVGQDGGQVGMVYNVNLFPLRDGCVFQGFREIGPV